jgi:hypothetical protein
VKVRVELHVGRYPLQHDDGAPAPETGPGIAGPQQAAVEAQDRVDEDAADGGQEGSVVTKPCP